ncbi:MAG: peptide-methionine (S)-S-oxide reductase MsrA [Betaproteobacteria bacterium]
MPRARLVAFLFGLVSTASLAAPVPAPAVDVAPAVGSQTAVFAGGCFWGVEAVFRHVKGVTRAVSGYAGGPGRNPTYEMVSSGTTGHAESVQVTYDPKQVSYGQLLRVFMQVAHDPTELNRQGPDVGTQYRSAIFYANDEQQKVARAYIAQLDAAKAFPRPIATQVAPLTAFHAAEAYHQDYLASHLTQPYIVYNDLPKLEALKKQFPAMYLSDRG